MTKLLTPQQIAEILGVKPSTIYQWTHQWYIPHVKLGRLVRFKEAEVTSWIDKRSNSGRKTMRLNRADLNLGD